MTVTLTDGKQTKIVDYIKALENQKDLKIRNLAKLLGMCYMHYQLYSLENYIRRIYLR